MGKELIKVPVGDWSNDGHEKCEDYYITANYPIEDMQQAYKDTCKKIGLQLNHTDNYTGIEGATRHRSWRVLLAEYREQGITMEAWNILQEHGFDMLGDIDIEEENDMAYFYPHDVFNLFMWFVSYSMPDDFKYEEFTIKAKPLIGYWCDLNHQIGYGVFD